MDEESSLLGKPWTYKLEIKRAADLPVFCDLAYVEYDFFGEPCTTEAVQQTTYSPVFDYIKIHHISSVTEEFLKFLKGSMEMRIHVTQHLENPPVRTYALTHSTYIYTDTSIYYIYAPILTYTHTYIYTPIRIKSVLPMRL